MEIGEYFHCMTCSLVDHFFQHIKRLFFSGQGPYVRVGAGSGLGLGLSLIHI